MAKTNVFYGLTVSILLIVITVVMIGWSQLTHEPLTDDARVFLLVSIALITGILFWTLAPGSKGELTLTKMGIKLGGSAGIGACYMVLAWQAQSYYERTKHQVLCVLPNTVLSEFDISSYSKDSISKAGKAIIDNNTYVYVAFIPRATEGTVVLKYPGEGASGMMQSTVRVTRAGNLIQK